MSTIYFATNRKPNRKNRPDSFGRGFSTNGLADLRFGKAEVSNGQVTRIDVAEEHLSKDPARSVLGSTDVFNRVREEMRNHAKDSLILIHGYNVSFNDALLATKKVKDNLAQHPLNVILFSWPSDGLVIPWVSYYNDRHDAKASGLAFARGFLKVAQFLKGANPQEACGQNLHLMAHSMGNYVLRNALQEIRKLSGNELPRIFENVFLMAADEDDDAFGHAHKLMLLPQLSRRTHVYFNNGDVAMWLGDTTKGHPDRLGCDGPRHPRQLPGKVTLIDCTPIVHGISEHGYYKELPRVSFDMLEVLANKDPDEIKGRKYIPGANRYRLKE